MTLDLAKNIFTGFPVQLAIPTQATTVFVSDFYVKELSGGAELTLKHLCDYAPDKKIFFCVHSSTITVEFLRKYKNKHFVFCNFTNIIDPEVFNELASGAYTYSIIEFDFKVCAYRSFLKHLQETKTNCDCKTKEHGKVISRFYSGAKRIFWMSERQRDLSLEYIELKNILPVETHGIILSSVFNIETIEFFRLIRSRVGVRKDCTCILPETSSWIKGVEQTKAACEVRGKAYEVLRPMENELFLQQMSQYKSFTFMPADYDTCPRVVIEAKLLGCELSITKKVLHADEPWFTGSIEKVEEYLLNRPKVFWDYFKSA